MPTYTRTLFLALLAMTALYLCLHLIIMYEIGSEEWEKQNPAYPVKNEHILSVFLAGYRAKLDMKGWSREGLIPRILRSAHESVYESAIRKIPDNDAERAVFLSLLLAPEFFTSKGKDPQKYIPLALEIFLLVSENSSKNEHVRTFERYALADTVVKYFYQYRGNSGMSNDEQEVWEKRLIVNSLNLLETIDLEHFVSRKKDKQKIIPISLLFRTYSRIIWQVKHLDPFSCSHPFVTGTRTILSRMPQYILVYNKIPLEVHQQNILNKMKEVYLASAPEVTAFIKGKCNE